MNVSLRQPVATRTSGERSASHLLAAGLLGIFAATLPAVSSESEPEAAPLSAYPAPRDVLDDRCWKRAFHETFDTLDWHDPDTGQGRWTPRFLWGNDIVINEELQFYADPVQFETDNVQVQDGILILQASPTPPALSVAASARPYISGLITSADSFSQYQGRFDISARVPQGQGLWSAAWLLPTFDQWPEGVAILPEIDVMEHLGHEPATYHTTLHTNQSGELASYPSDHTQNTPLSDDFHLYSVVWNDEAVHWYLDRRWVSSHPTPDDFTRPVHFLLNLAVGGTWPGAPDAETPFPARYRVDFVQAWQANGVCG